MAKQCATENCKIEAEIYCYHCYCDLCTMHFVEHKKEIQKQLPLLTDEINVLYEQLKCERENKPKTIPQCCVDIRDQVVKWRDECYQHIDIVYQSVLNQVESIEKNYQMKQQEKTKKNLQSLEEMRQQFNELLKEGNVTHRQIKKIQEQLEKIKQKKQEPVRDPNIHVYSNKIDVSNYFTVTDLHTYTYEEKPEEGIGNMPFVPDANTEDLEMCPLCDKIFPAYLSEISRTIHANTHLT